MARLAALLPDVPRFVETRWMLLGGYCEVLGLEEEAGAVSFVVRDREEKDVSVIGCPAPAAILDAVARNGNTGEVWATPENVSHVADALPGWEASPATLHFLGEGARLPKAPEGRVRFMGPSEARLLKHVPLDLRSWLARALRRRSPLAAAFVGGVPISFCIAVETEGLWDVSIDTLAGYRRRGHAAWCAAYMIRHQRQRGREPVWGALESNLPSMNLAVKLGFVPVDRIFVFERAQSR
ncbi:MAG: GNAT family N-acetyltransferase [Actinomycetota bacterium]|nr:GNAT family N-acetyltransferase [Actinomycetota bacterium]